MKNGVYALLAVVIGVALIGFIPGELSSLATGTSGTPVVQKSATTGAESGGQVPPNGLTPSSQSNLTVGTITITGRGFAGQFNDSVNGTKSDTTSALSTAAQAASTSAYAASTASQGAKVTPGPGGFVIGEANSFSAAPDPYADVRYYGLWVVGLVAALAVYLIARRLT